LRRLIAEYGEGLTKDPRRCKGLLLDLCGECRLEIDLLVTALEEGIAAEILASQDDASRQVLLPRLTRRLQEQKGLTAEAAQWAVESWALALGFVALQPPEPGTPPTIPTTPPPEPPKRPPLVLNMPDNWRTFLPAVVGGAAVVMLGGIALALASALGGDGEVVKATVTPGPQTVTPRPPTRTATPAPFGDAQEIADFFAVVNTSDCEEAEDPFGVAEIYCSFPGKAGVYYDSWASADEMNEWIATTAQIHQATLENWTYSDDTVGGDFVRFVNQQEGIPDTPGIAWTYNGGLMSGWALSRSDADGLLQWWREEGSHER